MSFEYFYKSQSDKYSFIRIPKAMMTEDVFLPKVRSMSFIR